MLELESADWGRLTHAYGSASDIPPLLRRLSAVSSSSNGAEPWHSLWSALAHQGDVYPASFAAVPHVIAALAQDPVRADCSYFHFPAWVEVCRAKSRIEVPAELSAAYFASLKRLPTLVAAAAEKEWDASFLACAMAAIAAAKCQPEVAEAVLELSSANVASEFIEWVTEQ